MTYKQVNAATEGKFEDVEVAWGGRPLQRQLAEFKFKQVGDQRHACDMARRQYFVCTGDQLRCRKWTFAWSMIRPKL